MALKAPNAVLMKSVAKTNPFLVPEKYVTPVHILLKATEVSRASARRELRSRIRASGADFLELYDKHCRKRPDSFSEILPWIIADMRGINADQIGRLAPGWIALLGHVSIVDDLIDGDESNSCITLVASLLIAHAMETFAPVLKNGVFVSLLAKAASAEMKQAKGSQGDQKQLAIQKNAFIHIFDNAFRTPINPRLTRDLAAFAQLIDDIVDYNDDSDRGVRSQLSIFDESDDDDLRANLLVYLRQAETLSRRLRTACAVNSHSAAYFEQMGELLIKFCIDLESRHAPVGEVFRRNVPFIAQST